MLRPALKYMALMLVLAGFFLAGAARAQSELDLAARLNTGYEMLEKGELDRARQLYEEMLRKYPGNPVALNNLAAILARRGKYEAALSLLTEALGRARGYRVRVDRVCDLESICSAARVAQDHMVGGDLEDLIRSNILMVRMAAASPRPK
jgi:tetratricopeptide (TPR) repeat protein